jgi:hypothetical protein
MSKRTERYHVAVPHHGIPYHEVIPGYACPEQFLYTEEPPGAPITTLYMRLAYGQMLCERGVLRPGLPDHPLGAKALRNVPLTRMLEEAAERVTQGFTQDPNDPRLDGLTD